MAHPFLLMQSRDPLDPMRGHEVECFADTLGVALSDVHVVDMMDRTPTKKELSVARGVLMGGSGDYSVLDPHPWVGRMVTYVRDVLLPSGVPTFASCFGLQVATLALGGAMVKDPERRELGTIELRLTEAGRADPIFGALPDPFLAQAGHNDRAVDLPPGADLLATTERCPVNAFRVHGKPFWATQFHPELDQVTVAYRHLGYLHKYRPVGLADDAPITQDPFLKTLKPSPDATALLRRFVEKAARK